MTHDPLHDLIRQADASVAPPPPLHDVARKALGIVRRRRNTRRGIVTAAFACLFVSLFLLSQHRTAPHTGELAQWDAEARSHERQADELWQRERQRILQARHQFLQRELDQAAYAMVYQADRISNDPTLQLAAADFYQQVLTDFPASPWATVARERLAHLHDRKEG
jgi:hypothetical protein